MRRLWAPLGAGALLVGGVVMAAPASAEPYPYTIEKENTGPASIVAGSDQVAEFTGVSGNPLFLVRQATWFVHLNYKTVLTRRNYKSHVCPSQHLNVFTILTAPLLHTPTLNNILKRSVLFVAQVTFTCKLSLKRN